MQKILDGLVERLRTGAGENLRSVVLYGSAAGGDFHEKHSDLNVLCLLHRADSDALGRLRSAARWLARKGHPMPVVFTLEELERAADIYAIELVEIKSRRRVLYGEDVFESIGVPMHLHRLQVERELRHNLIRFRQAFIAADGRKAVLALMTRSASIFALLFRHALIALNAEPGSSKRDAVERLAGILGFDSSGLIELFEIREGRRAAKALDVQEAFRKTLEAVTQAVNEIDNRLEELNH
jgi:predicted nucleotidyltransferase